MTVVRVGRWFERGWRGCSRSRMILVEGLNWISRFRTVTITLLNTCFFFYLLNSTISSISSSFSPIPIITNSLPLLIFSSISHKHFFFSLYSIFLISLFLFISFSWILSLSFITTIFLYFLIIRLFSSMFTSLINSKFPFLNL